MSMRADFILPAVLLVALFGLIAYVTAEDDTEPVIDAAPARCDGALLGSPLRELAEASGLAASRRTAGLFWAHNDSGEPRLYAMTAEGSIRGRVRVAGASVEDWEAVATAPCGEDTCLFIGDIGDNDRARSAITIYRTREPLPQDETTQDVTAIEGAYPGGPENAEAMFLVDGQLFILTKGENAPVRLYRFPALTPGTRHTLQRVATITPGAPEKTFRVTDAALSPDEKWVAVRTNDLLLFYDRASLVAGDPDVASSFDLTTLKEPQGEGVAWLDTQTLFLVGESPAGGTVARLTCPNLAVPAM